MYGTATPPIVAAVAALEPEMHANNADETTFVWIKLPGNLAIHFARLPYMWSVTPIRIRSSPIRMNSGSATSELVVSTFQGMYERTSHMGRVLNSHPVASAVTPIVVATWRPSAKA